MVDHVNGINALGGAGQAKRLRHAPNLEKAARKPDAVEVSAEMRELSQMKGIRIDKVMEVRRALEAGTYLDPQKLDVAFDRAIDDAFADSNAES